jgi:hypothetical protein
MKNKPKSREKLPLHQFIATGGNPKDFKGAVKNAVVNKKK